MAINLTKKQTISLEKEAGNTLKNISMGLGWDAAKKGGFFGRLAGPASIDLDASCIMLDCNREPVDLVWFRQLKSRDGSVAHSGDNRTGEGDGDDENISVDISRLPNSVAYLVFTVNSFTGQNFDSVENAYCRILNTDTGKELARFNLAEKGSHTGVVMTYLSRTATGWDITAVGTIANGRTVQDLSKQAANAVVA